MTSKVSSAAVAVGGAIISVLVTILIILNFLSGIVGGIWLAIEGQWRTIGWGFGLGFAMPFAWMLASLPTMGLVLLVGAFAEKGSRFFAGVIGFLGSLYSNTLISLWVFYVFVFFMGRSAAGSQFAYLFWAYSTMMAPLSYMASKEPPDSIGTSLGLFCAQLLFLVLSLLWAIDASQRTIIVAFACIIGAFSVFATYMSVASISPRYEMGENEY